ncbi:MAG: hypothetical protein SOW78_07320 [Clostridia bacterium]|nr:hypothetical protein [Clostridia bacterium]
MENIASAIQSAPKYITKETITKISCPIKTNPFMFILLFYITVLN